jgi:hypothetical protein
VLAAVRWTDFDENWYDFTFNQGCHVYAGGFDVMGDLAGVVGSEGRDIGQRNVRDQVKIKIIKWSWWRAKADDEVVWTRHVAGTLRSDSCI